MEQCKAIIISACMLSITVGLCNALKPGMILEKQIRFLISMLFVIGLAGGILKLRQEGIRIPYQVCSEEIQTKELTGAVQETILERIKIQTERALQELLAENGISCKDLSAEIHIDEGQRIYISEVSAECNQTEFACEILQVHLGEEVVLHVTEMAA